MGDVLGVQFKLTTAISGYLLGTRSPQKSRELPCHRCMVWPSLLNGSLSRTVHSGEPARMRLQAHRVVGGPLRRDRRRPRPHGCSGVCCCGGRNKRRQHLTLLLPGSVQRFLHLRANHPENSASFLASTCLSNCIQGE